METEDVMAGQGHLTAIFRGRRHYVMSQTQHGVWLQPFDQDKARIHVAVTDPDVIVNPTSDDLHLAAAFERGEIGAFEYPDGHTYPPNHEIPRPTTPNDSTTLH